MRHPTTRTWALPDEARSPLAAPLERTNLLTLAARPGRFEHHLLVVGQVGDAQLEVATASEPLSFAHVNLSDEYVVALPTGDALIDGFPFRVFLSDAESHADVARIRHRVGETILHPDGYAHWPGRLRAPYTMPAFPGARRAVLSAVVCASTRSPAKSRPLYVSESRAAEAKAYVDPAPPLLLADAAARGPIGQIEDVRVTIAEPPFAPPMGGWVLVLEAEGEDAHAGDLVRVARGAAYAGEGVVRAWLVESETAEPEPVPAVWTVVPEAPFACFEEAPAGALPWALGELHVEAVDDTDVAISIGETRRVCPRHWVARMLFRIALHTFVVDGRRVETPAGALGVVETYGGFGYRDVGARAFTLRDGAERVEAPVDEAELRQVLEALYRAVAPPGYVERLE